MFGVALAHTRRRNTNNIFQMEANKKNIVIFLRISLFCYICGFIGVAKYLGATLSFFVMGFMSHGLALALVEHWEPEDISPDNTQIIDQRNSISPVAFGGKYRGGIV